MCKLETRPRYQLNWGQNTMQAGNLTGPTLTGKIRVEAQDIYWEYFGDLTAKRETLCLANGLAMRTASWHGILPWVLDEYNVLLFDYPGQGESTSEDIPVSIPGLCYYLYNLLNHLELEKIHLVGISYGAFIAFDFARLYEERLYTVTISGGYLHQPDNIDYRLRSKRELLQENKFDEFVDILFDELFGPTFKAEQSESFARLKKIFYDRYINRLYSLVRLFDAQKEYVDNLAVNRPGYKAITVPVYVVTGDEDIVFPVEHQKKITEVVPNSRFEKIPGAGHLVYLQMPNEFFSRLKRFLWAKSINN